MATKYCNAFDIDETICKKPLYEHDAKAENFAVEISRISIELNKISGGSFEYNEDCVVIDITSDEDAGEIGDKLSEEITDFPFIIFEDEGERFLAVCPYDQGGISIDEVIDKIYEIVDE